MSRIGNQPISIPESVTITQSDKRIMVKGPKGELSVVVPKEITTKQEDGQIVMTRSGDSINEKALHGLARSLVANAVKGVTEGFAKTLEIKGVGYRAKIAGDKLVLTIGFSHPVEIEQPPGITFQTKGAKIMAYEKASAKSLGDLKFGDEVSVFVGPEGGFTPEEAGIFEREGGEVFHLGKRINVNAHSKRNQFLQILV